MFALGGLAVGAAVGAVVALMLAPKKGSELRADLDVLGKNTRYKGHRLYARAKGLIPNNIKMSEVLASANGAGSDGQLEVNGMIG